MSIGWQGVLGAGDYMDRLGPLALAVVEGGVEGCEPVFRDQRRGSLLA